MGVLRHSIARALFLPLPLFALMACGITLPEGMTDGDAATTPTDARVPEVDATTADSSVADTGVADDAASSDAAPIDAGQPDAGPVDSGFDAGPLDAGPVDSGPPPVPCTDNDNEKQPIVDAALARCRALINATFIGGGFAPKFAAGTYCETSTKRAVLCLFQPETEVGGGGLDAHCAKAKIQDGAAILTANAYYRSVSGNAGTRTGDPDPAIRRLSTASGAVSRWARQTGGAGDGQLLSLDRDGKVEALPDTNLLQKAACNFVLK
jgi:hypothetical protein